jgi:DNA modification methylase
MGTFFRSRHELVYVFRKGEKPHINNFELGQFGRYRTNVWEYSGANSFKGNGKSLLQLHPTVKPVSLVADAIRDCSHRGGVIVDPFVGSGTLILAAERTHRIAYAMELDPRYIDVTIARWERVTGKTAIHADTGMSWQALGEVRRNAGLLGDAE